MKKLKTIIVVFFLMMLIPNVAAKEICDIDKISIESLSLEEVSDNVKENKEATASGLTINLNLSMLGVGDMVKYKMIIKNNLNEDFKLDNKNFSINSNYIEYSINFDNNSNIVKANSKKTVYLIVKYKNEVPIETFESGPYTENKIVTLDMLSNNIRNIGKNPKTKNHFLYIVLIILIISIISLIFFKKSRKNILLFLIFWLSIIIPISVYAVCEYNIKIESNINIMNPVIYPDGKNKKSVVTGDKVKIGEEEFYVVSNNGKDLVLLAHYNLKVGNIYTLENSSVKKIGEYTNQDDRYGLQSPEARGYVGGQDDIRNGTVAFSNSFYWQNEIGEGLKYPGISCSYTYTPGTKCAYIYDENSIVKQYIDNYKNELEKTGIRIKEARLLKFEEAYELGCGHGTNNCNSGSSNAPAWVYETTYWLGSADNYDTWFIFSTGQFGGYYNNDNMYGIRPVIII